MTREEREKLIKLLKYSHSIGADYVITDKDADEIIKALEQEPCEDCISRQATIEAFQMFRGYEANRTNAEWVDRIETVVKKLPSVTPQPKTGHWIDFNGNPVELEDGIPKDSCYCSICDKWLVASDEYACYGNYCPNCGTKMES